MAAVATFELMAGFGGGAGGSTGLDGNIRPGGFGGGGGRQLLFPRHRGSPGRLRRRCSGGDSIRVRFGRRRRRTGSRRRHLRATGRLAYDQRPAHINGNSVDRRLGGAGIRGGSNGTAGAAIASGIFLQGSGTVTFSPTGSTQIVNDVIGDEAGNGGSAANKWSLSKLGTGTLVLGAANSYTGGTTVDAGILQLGAGGSLASTGALTVNAGTFDLNGHTQTVGEFSGLGGTVNLGNGALTVTEGIAATYAGIITGSGSLTKTGAATLTLTGANNYLGGTTVSAGTLAGTADSLGGNIVVAGGANVTFDQASGTQGGYGGQLSGGGSLTKTGAGMLFLTNTNSYQGGTVVTGGGLSISSDANLGNGGTVALGAGTSRWPSPPAEPTATPSPSAAIPPSTSTRA